jgi:hypothetical protein
MWITFLNKPSPFISLLPIPVTRVMGMIVFTPPRPDGVYLGKPSRKNWNRPI